jgi:hypothetical protein
VAKQNVSGEKIFLRLTKHQQSYLKTSPRFFMLLYMKRMFLTKKISDQNKCTSQEPQKESKMPTARNNSKQEQIVDSTQLK